MNNERNEFGKPWYERTPKKMWVEVFFTLPLNPGEPHGTRGLRVEVLFDGTLAIDEALRDFRLKEHDKATAVRRNRLAS